MVEVGWVINKCCFCKIKKSLSVLHKNDRRTEEIKKEELEEKRYKSSDAGDLKEMS